jgi:hypothetical protein
MILSENRVRSYLFLSCMKNKNSKDRVSGRRSFYPGRLDGIHAHIALDKFAGFPDLHIQGAGDALEFIQLWRNMGFPVGQISIIIVDDFIGQVFLPEPLFFFSG